MSATSSGSQVFSFLVCELYFTNYLTILNDLTGCYAGSEPLVVDVQRFDCEEL